MRRDDVRAIRETASILTPRMYVVLWDSRACTFTPVGQRIGLCYVLSETFTESEALAWVNTAKHIESL